MQRITLALVVAVALAAPAAAQESAPAPERRGTIGAVILHFSSYENRQWPYVGFDGTFRVGRFEVQATYFRDTVRYDDWTSTLEWYSGGIIWPLSPLPARFRPHVLTGFQSVRVTSDGSLARRYPSIYGGLGAELPLGGRLFARVQYMMLRDFGAEPTVGHAGRASVGIGF